MRAVSLVRSGIWPLSDIRVPTSCTFGWTFLSISGSNKQLIRAPALDGILLDDGDDVLLEVGPDVAEPLRQPGRRASQARRLRWAEATRASPVPS